METRVQIVAILVSALLLLGLLELVRQRRLLERYALLWMGSALALLVLSIWTGLLEQLANAVGIIYPPSALFVFAFGFILILLLHFSVAVSRLADQNKILAQHVARLEERQRRLEARGGGEDAAEREPALRE
ncbi:MAG TPA: DUF2304 domain-containing protein [Thermoleophilaceae bacterium]|jgi:hypothetical protein